MKIHKKLCFLISIKLKNPLIYNGLIFEAVTYHKNTKI